MSYHIIDVRLGSAVANDATTTLSYPAGTDAGTFKGAVGHKMMLGSVLLLSPADFTLTFGASDITLTNKYGAGWVAGERIYLELQVAGSAAIEGIKRSIAASAVYINIGAPKAAAAAGVAAAQAVAAAGNLNLTSGTVTFDVPRGVQAVSTAVGDTTQTLTFTGTDEYGAVMVERITLNGTTAVFGKKAFKTVTKVAASAATAGNVSAGSSDVLGLPLFLQDSDFVLKEIQDDAVAAAGIFAAGDQSEPAATTGDVRGTYDPSAACNGAITFRLVAIATDPTYKGLGQYAG